MKWKRESAGGWAGQRGGWVGGRGRVKKEKGTKKRGAERRVVSNGGQEAVKRERGSLGRMGAGGSDIARSGAKRRKIGMRICREVCGLKR